MTSFVIGIEEITEEEFLKLGGILPEEANAIGNAAVKLTNQAATNQPATLELIYTKEIPETKETPEGMMASTVAIDSPKETEKMGGEKEVEKKIRLLSRVGSKLYKKLPKFLKKLVDAVKTCINWLKKVAKKKQGTSKSAEARINRSVTNQEKAKRII